MRFLLSLLLLVSVSALAAPSAGESAAALRAKYSELQPELRENAFKRPLHLDSQESRSDVMGNAYAVLNHPFAKAAPALAEPEGWCEILMLPFNTKQCTVSRSGERRVGLEVRIGSKSHDSAEQAYPIAFAYNLAARNDRYLRVVLDAEEGPFSTRDYRIVLEAVPLENGRTFLHLGYSYGFGMPGRLAMQAYLATVGSGKVGFSQIEKSADGEPRFVGGMRGVVERNTMRYYLAIEAFLGSREAPKAERAEKSARDWFAASERYPRQLHEMNEQEYLAMKRKEYARQAQVSTRERDSGS